MDNSGAHRLVLIDGNAILHRAYHALPPLTALDGSLVNAVYGFTSMLLKIVGDLRPTHLAVAFDRPKPTFRKQLFAGYQAKRPKMADELASQIARVHEVIQAFHIPIFEVDGYEADDVIGTLCQKVTSDKRQVTSNTKGKNVSRVTSHVSPIDQVIIVTGDRDMLQLVDDERVYVYMPTKGLREAKLYGEKEVVERMGVAPNQIPDLKALAGDASDNYSGVNGIGPKTAVEILKQFPTVKALYEAIQRKDRKAKNLSETVLTKLSHGAEDAVLSKNLAIIRTDVPLPVDIGEMRLKPFDTPTARKVLEDLHFYSLMKRLGALETWEFTNQSRPRENGESKKEKKTKPVSNQQQLF